MTKKTVPIILFDSNRCIILKSLLDDYEMAKAQDYDGDRFSFIQDKFVKIINLKDISFLCY